MALMFRSGKARHTVITRSGLAHIAHTTLSGRKAFVTHMGGHRLGRVSYSLKAAKALAVAKSASSRLAPTARPIGVAFIPSMAS